MSKKISIAIGLFATLILGIIFGFIISNKNEELEVGRFQFVYHPIAAQHSFILDTTTGRIYQAYRDPKKNVDFFKELLVIPDNSTRNTTETSLRK